MAKNLQINLAFTADTGMAMANLQKLRTSLTEISSLPFTLGKNISSDLKLAATSAQQLQQHLGAAMDLKTGNLNLSKLETSLKSAGHSLSTLTAGLLRAGTTGEQAFLSTYSAIARANISLKKSNGLLSQFALTLKNTAKWQLSSTLLHGVISGFRSALTYAKDLNTSLNKIQIVTGQSAEQMADFAKQANKAAKELKATTVAYTDAALIYYQQGLRGDAVTQRADTTVKLANVTGESAQTVSEWMTAVWNNFDDGSQKLEYYADVMTALGAATASSSKEIAAGLEKFAAVADTVGLSYEYATTALATITATTRQSADVVGTALKTLFARIQDLDLGNTLEDGTTLGSYSEALNKVGINIKEANGSLKNMDLILDEMGAKWEQLDADQQVALAKSVAGIRQYTQLIALMDNYDYFKENLTVAENADGTLAQQADIYEKSWSAASKNVKASLEDMYNTLIPTDFIIDFTNGLAKVVSGFSSILEAAGGLKTIMLLIANTVLNKFQVQMANSLDNTIARMSKLLHTSEGVKGIFTNMWNGMMQPFKNVIAGFQTVKSELNATKQIMQGNQMPYNALRQQETNAANKQLNHRTELQKQQKEMLNNALIQKNSKGAAIPLSDGFVSQIKGYQQLESYNIKILNLKQKMTAEEFQVFQSQQQQVLALNEQKAAGIDRISNLQLELDILKEEQSVMFSLKDFKNVKGTGIVANSQQYVGQGAEEKGYGLALKAAADPKLGGSGGLIEDKINAGVSSGKQSVAFQNAEALRAAQTNILEVVTNTKNVELEIENILKNQTITAQDKQKLNRQIISDALRNHKITEDQAKELRNSVTNGRQLLEVIKGMSTGASKAATTLKVSTQMIDSARKKALELFTINQKNKNIVGQTDSIFKSMDKNLATIMNRGKTFGNIFMKGIQGASQFAMGLNMVTSSLKQVQEEGFNLGNIATLLMGVSMTASSLGAIFGMLGGAISKLTAQYGPYLVAQKIAEVNNEKGIKTAAINILNKAAEKELTEEDTKAKLANMLAKQANLTAEEANIAASAIMASTKTAETTAEGVNTAGIWANSAAWYANPIMWIAVIILAVVAAIIALVAAFAGLNKQIAENRQRQIDNAKENLELIKSNQELSNSIGELVDKYKELQEQGKSTYETMAELKDQIPKLIDSYMKLEQSLDSDFGLEKLKALYEYFLATGDITGFEEEKAEVDAQVAAEKLSTAKGGARAASTKLVESAAKGDGKTTANQYKVTIGGTATQDIVYNGKTYYSEQGGEEAAASDLLKEVMGEDMWDGSQIKFDLTNTRSVMEGYEKMAEARAKMESSFSAEELGHMDTYRELVRELDEMSEAYGELSELQGTVVEAAKEEFNANDSQKAIAMLNQYYGKDGITSLQEYTEGREKLIEALQKEYDITEQQAEALLGQSEVFSKFELSMELFDQEGKLATDIQNKGTVALNDVKAWYDSIPEEDKTLFMGLDFSEIESLEHAKEKMEELREEAKRNSIKEEAIASGIEATELDMYAQVLARSNSELEQNSALTDQVALSNLKLNKGLKTLQDSWEDNYEALKTLNTNTPEYAQALASVHDALEEAFDVSVSAEFIETNLEKINALAEGDVEVLEELQTEMAKDYVLNLSISDVAFNEGATAVAVAEGRQALLDMLDSIDTSMEIGEGTTLSGDFLNTIQGMLDSGQLAEDELQKIMHAKGYELEISGWKEVDGPTKTITQEIIDWTGVPQKKTIKETEKLQVPIINGEGSAIKGTSAPATVVKSTSSNNINTSQTNKTKENEKEAKNRVKGLKDEQSRYHKLTKTIEDNERALTNLGKAKDRVFGTEKLALMDQEISKQKEIIENNKKLLEEAQEYLAKDQQSLINATAKGLSIEFDSSGNIANYEELEQYYIDLLTKNANSSNYEDLEEQYQDFKDAAQKYEESLEKVENSVDAVNDGLDELYSKNLEKITLEVEMKVEIAEDDKAYIDFMLQETENDAFAVAENINLQTQSGETTMSKIAATKDGIEKTKTALQNGEITPEQAAKQLRQYRDDLISYNADLLEIRNTVEESLVNAYEAWNEELDTNASKIEHLTSITESLKNIVDIVGKDTLGLSDAAMKKFSDTSVEVANNALEASKSKLDANQAYLDEVKQKQAEAIATYGEDSHEAKYWADVVKGAEEQVMSAREDFMSSWETALTAAADAFSASVDQITENFSESMGGMYKNLDELQEAFDKQKEINDRYLENYEKTYEISKLNRSIQDSINKTSSVASQKELRGLQQDLLAMQEDGVNVSERDIQFMQKKYDLMVAEQALRDAQNAKSVVRLRRDSEGNFGYTYTADQSTVDKAQQNYEDKLYAMQKFGDESLEEIQQQILETNQEFKQALEDIANDETLSLEEKKEKAAQVTKFYQDKLKYLTDEANKFMQRGQEINVKYNTEMASSFNDTLLGKMYPDLTSFEGYYEQGMSNMNTAGSDFTIALEGYQSRIDTAFDLAGQDVETFANDVAGEGGYLDQAQEAGDDTAENAEDLASRMKEALITGEDSAIKSIASFQEDFGQKMKTVRDETGKTILEIKNLINELNALNNTTTTTFNYTPTTVSGTNTTNDTTTNNNTTTTTTTTRAPVQNPIVEGTSLKIGNQTFIETKDGKFIHNNDIIKDWGADYGDPNHWFEISTSAKKLSQLEAVKMSLVAGSTFSTNDLTGDDETYGTGSSPGSANYNIYWDRNSGKQITVTNVSGDYVKIKRTDGNKLAGKDWLHPGSTEVWVKKNALANSFSFDTGGYTGAWGPEGRLAMLHQKEIVLNARDTENFLAAIGIVRDISDQIERNAMVMQYQNAMANNKFALGNVGETFEQNVHITAEFPNATNHSEIEEAFRNLTNLASQYANRKRV